MQQDMTLRKAIEFAITTEEIGAQCYRRLASKFADSPELQAVFVSLMRDEESHERQFAALLAQVPKDEAPQDFAQHYGVLKAWSLSEFFSHREGLMSKLDSIRTPADALQRALDMERSTLGYYLALRDVLGPDTILEDIIEAERQHLNTVMEVLEGYSSSPDLADAR